MNNAVVTLLSLLVTLLVSYCIADDLSHPTSHGDHMSNYPQNPSALLALEDEEMDKRGWNQLQSSGWGKRAWNQLQSGWGKRGWQDLHSTGWGKRSWNQLRGSGWGKRGWDNLHGSGWGKRAWSQLQGGWGKRDLGTIPDAVIDEESNTMDYVPEDIINQEEKRAWNNLKGNWGKRDPAWHNLKGLWGKRGTISEFSSPYAYSRGLSGGFFQPDDNLLRLE
uniref:Prothoracicostatic peptide n=1 Tax=Cacopsylla melanoneura TaxID=428564 RepID=A0A8D9EUI3_9HEMI